MLQCVDNIHTLGYFILGPRILNVPLIMLNVLFIGQLILSLVKFGK